VHGGSRRRQEKDFLVGYVGWCSDSRLISLAGQLASSSLPSVTRAGMVDPFYFVLSYRLGAGLHFSFLSLFFLSACSFLVGVVLDSTDLEYRLSTDSSGKAAHCLFCRYVCCFLSNAITIYVLLKLLMLLRDKAASTTNDQNQSCDQTRAHHLQK
jgi:hypothetical protein